MALKPIRVSQLNKYIGTILKTDPILGNILVTGELSNVKYHGSGHVYFSLKDENSKISGFMHSAYVESLRYQLTDGLEVTVAGYINLYEPNGTYSINAKSIEVSGMGNLNLAFKALFEKLEKEGLFASEHKKTLPLFPKKICIVTSETGAAVRDILKIITSRNNVVKIMIYHCLVQGSHAAGEIAAAIDDVNENFKDIELIIIGRGGGSAEELWAFNEEIVARSIFKSEIPIISAVGHETDFSISDYVADVRAATPTEAAAIAVPDTHILRENLDNISSMLHESIKKQIAAKQLKLSQYDNQLMTRLFRNRISLWQQKCDMINNNMDNYIQKTIIEKRNMAEKNMSLLELSNPLNILKKGYSILYDESGKPVMGIHGLKEKSHIQAVMQDGSAEFEISSLSVSESE